MEQISQELLDKYHILDFDSFCKRHSEIEFYQTFLIATDHIPAKIEEAIYLGEQSADYTEILSARKLCRAKINELL